ncbi:MAG: alpha-galactosidase [Acidobacteriota bacterium]|nr:alpha-galactosidase [Acidobacteriota bacterium]
MRPLPLAALCFLVTMGSAMATQFTRGEIYTAQQWAAALFSDGVMGGPEAPSLSVERNNDAVQLMGRNDGPLTLGGKRYHRGIFAHADSRIVVRLPRPAGRFLATVGVDSNRDTLGGRGSVTFRVVTDEPLWESALMREGAPPIEVACDLGGATAFALEVTDGGDGIACDQADWADARVEMADGSILWLDELPLVDERVPGPSVAPPFSFLYGGAASADLLDGWEAERSSRMLDEARIEHRTTYRDPETGLATEVVGIEYTDSSVIEWTVTLENTGNVDTPLIESLQALDAPIERWAWPPSPASEFVLHHFVGSPCEARDFQPLETRLDPGATKRVTAAGGRPTNTDLCYFNLAWPSQGVILGIGWPGQWAASFERDDGAVARVRIGQELTRFTLHPGERVRTPLVALLFWRGDWVRGQNLWRKWMLAHNLPRPGGELPPSPQLNACSSHQFGEMIHADSASQVLFIDRYLEEGLPLDYWWMDAGWYPNESGWGQTGTWEVDQQRFPGGLRPITDHGHERGVRSIVWFEPERVATGAWLYETHPEWLLGVDGQQKLLNLGHPEAREWLTEHVHGLLESEGIDLYRQDFNMDPLSYWRANDAEDRQGITEIRHVEGYLAYWDELRRRHPNMLIDSCASGGRRNDLETLRRAVPLLRSDYIFEPVGNQAHTYGISFWMPFYGTGAGTVDAYAFRSVMCPSFTACYDMRRDDIGFDELRRLMGQWERVAPVMMMGDYYPLTEYSLANDVWIGWQFDLPDEGRGVIQVFRHADSIYQAAQLPLRGLDPSARYEVADVDTGEARVLTGAELIETGVPVRIDTRPGALLLEYRRVD